MVYKHKYKSSPASNFVVPHSIENSAVARKKSFNVSWCRAAGKDSVTQWPGARECKSGTASAITPHYDLQQTAEQQTAWSAPFLLCSSFHVFYFHGWGASKFYSHNKQMFQASTMSTNPNVAKVNTAFTASIIISCIHDDVCNPK